MNFKTITMKIIQRSFWVFLAFLIILFFYSCKELAIAPTNEKQNAEKNIELAKSVGAQTHAASDLNLAEEQYQAGSDLFSEEDSANNEEAKNKFILAAKHANDAYQKSIGPYTQKLIDETAALFSEAKPEIKVMEGFNDALTLNEEAQNELDNKNYLGAKEKTMEAREKLQDLIKLHEEQNTQIIATDTGESLSYDDQIGYNEVIYEVKYNPEDRDCLWKIADREMGNPLLWQNIFDRNNNIIKNPDLIYPGQKLVLPYNKEN